MKNIFTTKNLMYVGIGLATAFVVYNVLVNREKASETAKNDLMAKSEDKSDFCGCGA